MEVSRLRASVPQGREEKDSGRRCSATATESDVPRRFSTGLWAVCLLAAALIVFGVPVHGAWAAAEKVDVCHVPPGNPENAHTVVVGQKAAEAHLANHPGDLLGDCSGCVDNEQCPDDGDPCTDEVCEGNQCLHIEKQCDDGDPCTSEACSASTGECVQTGFNPGAECMEPPDACTVPESGVCDAEGNCVGEPIPNCCTEAADCDDMDVCTDDSCVDGLCDHAASTCPDVALCRNEICQGPDVGCIQDPTPDPACCDIFFPILTAICQANCEIVCSPEPAPESPTGLRCRWNECKTACADAWFAWGEACKLPGPEPAFPDDQAIAECFCPAGAVCCPLPPNDAGCGEPRIIPPPEESAACVAGLGPDPD